MVGLGLRLASQDDLESLLAVGILMTNAPRSAAVSPAVVRRLEQGFDTRTKPPPADHLALLGALRAGITASCEPQRTPFETLTPPPESGV